MYTPRATTLLPDTLPSANVARLMVIDDATDLTATLQKIRLEMGYEAVGFTSGGTALAALQEREFDLCLVDLMMPDMDGIALLTAAQAIDPHMIGIIMTRQGAVETAVEAIKAGAYDYVVKPFEWQTLLQTLSRALDFRRLRMENIQLRETAAMYELSNTLASTLDSTAVLHKIADAVLQECDADEVSIMLPIHEDQELHIALARGGCRADIQGKRVPIEQGIAGWVARHREPLLLHGHVDDPRFCPIRPRNDIGSSILMPLLARGRLVGILNVNATHSRRFDAVLFKSLTLIANSASSLLEAARLYEEVRQAEEQYRSIFEHAIEGIYQSTPQGRFIAANPALARMLGYNSPEELIGAISNIDDQLYVEPQRRAELQWLLGEREVLQGFEVRLYRKDGSTIWAKMSARAVRDTSGALLYYEGSVEDISERKRTEEELQRQREALYQTEKLSAMGSLLAGVAHELNNPLSVVLGQTALLSQLTAGSMLAVRAEKIGKAAERCARIVKNFLALARQRPPERQKVRLNQIVRETVELLAYPLRVDNVEVVLDLSEAMPTLCADPHQLHQVLINIISNAHQALRETPAPRRITISTQFDPLQARVCLAVADTGPGVPLELQRRIFEPFFTTKSPGQGTGLGLSICRGIIDNHDGSLWVESPPGQGAIFQMELPVRAPHLDMPAVPVADFPAAIRGRAILVVDDEPEVAEVLAEMLTLDGHEVETVANGVVALDKLQERDYDLILSDLRMPELDGPGLYKELERRHPDLLHRIIFLTGDTLSPESRGFLEQTRASAISKPFAPETSRQVVQKVLQEIRNGKG
jgi:PAS domain S-box-containing protein